MLQGNASRFKLAFRAMSYVLDLNVTPCQGPAQLLLTAGLARRITLIIRALLQVYTIQTRDPTTERTNQ